MYIHERMAEMTKRERKVVDCGMIFIGFIMNETNRFINLIKNS